MIQTEAMRSAKYVALLRERFGPDAADRVVPAVPEPDACSQCGRPRDLEGFCPSC